MERQHQGMDRPGVWQVPEGSGEQGKMDKTGCKIICGVPTTPAVKGLMIIMMMMMMMMIGQGVCIQRFDVSSWTSSTQGRDVEWTLDGVECRRSVVGTRPYNGLYLFQGVNKSSTPVAASAIKVVSYWMCRII